MATYLKPNMEIVEFTAEEVIRTSGGSTGPIVGIDGPGGLDGENF